MARLDEEFRRLINVERRLLNAASEVRTAEAISGEGMLRDRIQATREALEEALELAQRAKRMTLTELRSMRATHRAA